MRRPPNPTAALLGLLLLGLTAPGAAHAQECVGPAPTVLPRALPPGRSVSPPPKSPPRGVTLGINGAIFTGVGATLMLLAAVSLAEGASCTHACGFWGETSGKVLLALGAPPFAVGLPLFAVGLARHRRWRAWERQRLLELQPWLGVRGPGSAGVTLRF